MKVTEEEALLAITRRHSFAYELYFLALHGERTENFIHYSLVLEIIFVLILVSHYLDAKLGLSARGLRLIKFGALYSRLVTKNLSLFKPGFLRSVEFIESFFFSAKVADVAPIHTLSPPDILAR